MKKLFSSILVLGLLLSGNAEARTKTNITIKDLKERGFELKGTTTREGYNYYYFENDKDFFECIRDTQGSKRVIKCFHLSDGN